MCYLGRNVLEPCFSRSCWIYLWSQDVVICIFICVRSHYAPVVIQQTLCPTISIQLMLFWLDRNLRSSTSLLDHHLRTRSWRSCQSRSRLVLDRGQGSRHLWVRFTPTCEITMCTVCLHVLKHEFVEEFLFQIII